MKKLFLILLASLLSLAVFSQSKKGLSAAYKQDGLLLFVDSEPVNEYDVIGHVKVAIAWKSDYDFIKKRLIKKTLDDYKSADGIIINMTTSGADRATIIKFKDQNAENLNHAVVQKFDGVYVFTDCEPVLKYDMLTRKKAGLTWTGQYSEVKSKLVKKSLKETPACEGIIVNDGRAAVIKFQE